MGRLPLPVPWSLCQSSERSRHGEDVGVGLDEFADQRRVAAQHQPQRRGPSLLGAVSVSVGTSVSADESYTHVLYI